MIKVCFVCHGNICRSPMAEYLFKYLVAKYGKKDKFLIESMATSSEEIGNPIHYGTRKILDRYNLDYSKKRAKQFKLSDYNSFDYIIGMDSYNVRNLERICNKNDKIYRLLDFTDLKRDISDPWYTGDFEQTYNDIIAGLEGFYNYLLENKLV